MKKGKTPEAVPHGSSTGIAAIRRGARSAFEKLAAPVKADLETLNHMNGLDANDRRPAMASVGAALVMFGAIALAPDGPPPRPQVTAAAVSPPAASGPKAVLAPPRS